MSVKQISHARWYQTLGWEMHMYRYINSLNILNPICKWQFWGLGGGIYTGQKYWSLEAWFLPWIQEQSRYKCKSLTDLNKQISMAIMLKLWILYTNRVRSAKLRKLPEPLPQTHRMPPPLPSIWGTKKSFQTCSKFQKMRPPITSVRS